MAKWYGKSSSWNRCLDEQSARQAVFGMTTLDKERRDSGVDCGIGVDLGGTKIEAVVLDAAGRELFRARVPTPRPEQDADDAVRSDSPVRSVSIEALASAYRATLDAIAGLVDRAAEVIGDRDARRIPVGVGIPGAVDASTGLVKNANSTWLIGRPMVEDLSALLGRSVRVSNDANCFALSEWADGAGALIASETGAKPNVLWGVILGTGVGSGIVVNGRIIEGANRIGGEWGHNPLPHMTADEIANSPRCYCGADAFGRASAVGVNSMVSEGVGGVGGSRGGGGGCIETWCSGPAFERDFAAAGIGQHPSASRVRSLRASQIAAIAQGDKADDPADIDIVIDDELRALARATVDRLIDRLGRAVAGVINVLDPDVIVLGGGVGRIERLYDPVFGVLAKAGPWVFSATGGGGGGTADRLGTATGDGFALRTRLLPPVHGDSSGVRGAARLWNYAMA